MTKAKSGAGTEWAVALGVLALSWVLVGLTPLLVAGGVVFCLVRRAAPLALIPLCLNPLSAGFYSGVADYLGGAPQLERTGRGEDPIHRNLDPGSRCYYRATGRCVPRGAEWARQGPHNAAVRLLVWVFGPARNAYDGPYPTRAEALEAMRSVSRTPRSVFWQKRVVVEGREIELGDALFKALSARCELEIIFIGAPRMEKELRVKAAFFKERCLVVQILFLPDTVTDPAFEERSGVYREIVLVDYPNRSIFAGYH
jgi:hypothetical protein